MCMNEQKTILQEVKEIFKWFWEMTTWRTIAVNLIILLILAATALIAAGIYVIGKNGFVYLTELYRNSEPGEQLNAITAGLWFFLGVVITVIGNIIANKRLNNAKRVKER